MGSLSGLFAGQGNAIQTTGGMPVNAETLKAMQLGNQHLTRPADRITVARDLCGVQAQFMRNALHALRIRCVDWDDAAGDAGLVKSWTIRGTVHVFAEADLPLFIRERTERCDGYAAWQRPDGKLGRADDGNSLRVWALSPERQRQLSQVILDAVRMQECSREDLKARCRAAGMTTEEEEVMFHPWGGGVRDLCERGMMCYAAREEKVFRLCPPFDPMPAERAGMELARRYFTHIAPATIRDAAYFFGCRQADVKRWMDGLPVKCVKCDGRTYYYIPSGDPEGGEIPECIFLAGFDQLMLGYRKEDSLYLPPEHLRGIFNLAGIVMPALLLRGRVVGRWKEKGGRLMVTPFESIAAPDRRRIQEAAAALWGGKTQVSFET